MGNPLAVKGLIKTGGSVLFALSLIDFPRQVSKDEAIASYSCAFRFLCFIKSPSSSYCNFTAAKAFSQASMFGIILVLSITCPLSCTQSGTGVVPFALSQFVSGPELNGCFIQKNNAAVPDMEANDVFTPL